MTLAQLAELPEYSCSLPTGTRIGKRWRRNLNAFVYPAMEAVWFLGEYAQQLRPGTILIRWTPVKLVGPGVTALDELELAVLRRRFQRKARAWYRARTVHTVPHRKAG